MDELTVVKVGGSLFDHPALGPGLRRWLAEQTSSRYIIVAGGGAAADVIRSYHRTHQPPESLSHWLAIRMMDINGELLRHFFADSAEVVAVSRFCTEDEDKPSALSHDWCVTSDAIAARIAEVHQAARLVVLKSVDLPESIAWEKAAERGLVDQAFGEVVTRANLKVEWINFRSYLDGFC